MTTRRVQVTNALGIHARAAARFVEVASRFPCHIRVSLGARSVDGKSILGLLLLAAAKGTTIAIEADGVEEAQAIAALVAVVEEGFGDR